MSRVKEAQEPSTLAQALQAPTLLAASAAQEAPASQAASSSAGGLFSHLSLQHPTDSESSSSDDEAPGRCRRHGYSQEDDGREFVPPPQPTATP